MAESVPQSRWRLLNGVCNVLFGTAFLLFSAACAVGLMQLVAERDSDALPAGLWALFTGGVGAALLWIGVGDLRSRRRPTWIVRIALYVCVIAIAIPMAFVTREAVYKRRAVENLRQLQEALEKYDTTYIIRPAASPPLPGELPPGE